MAELKQPRAHITDCIGDVEWDYYPVTAEANTLTLQGDRQSQYGHPLPWAERFAGCLRAVFGWDVKAQHIALLMVLFKVCREAGGKHQRDNFVDIAGYAECGMRVCEAQGKLAAVQANEMMTRAKASNAEWFAKVADAAAREDWDTIQELVGGD
jgi:hypothetical protein